LRAGASVVLVDRFDVGITLEQVDRHGVTVLTAVPQMWASWADFDDAPRNAMGSVTRATSSAAHLPPATVAAVYARFGVRVAAGYGLTETAGTIVLDDVTDPMPGTVGRPLGEVQLRLADGAGQDVELGDPGEIWVRGPSIFGSYAGSRPVLRSMLSPDGWCRTGDVGVFDEDGRLSVVDRLKDVIIVGGFNVAPTEVEDVLVAHPAVGAALVVGEPDDRSGERVVAFVTPANGSALDAEVLLDHCSRRLARYKVPRRIEVRVELPTTEAGKAVRRLAR
jgi:long-chain acyl-CoA synthetase